ASIMASSSPMGPLARRPPGEGLAKAVLAGRGTRVGGGGCGAGERGRVRWWWGGVWWWFFFWGCCCLVRVFFCCVDGCCDAFGRGGGCFGWGGLGGVWWWVVVPRG
ncbi:hypothetical protein RA268_27875, partial [Pseudomonas syringae pv. tagetis]